MPKNEIRILIDRIPNTLTTGQAPDATAQRILPLISEFHYHLGQKTAPEDFILKPANPTLPDLHFVYVRDELSRAMLFMSGRTDILFDTLSLSKTEWIKKQGIRLITAPGFTFSFVGFQLTDPILKDIRVRRAIQLALPVSDWMHYKLFDWVEALPGTSLMPDLKQANRLLDEAGFPRKGNCPAALDSSISHKECSRFSLQYFTTPVREGNEMALLVREALKNLSIQVTIQPVETSLFYSKLKRGEFQIFAGRIPRNDESVSVSDFLSPKGIRNYFHYESLPDQKLVWNDVKEQVFRELPIIPLFNWKHAVVISDRIDPLPETSAKLDDSFRFLNSLRLK
jgi:peptide/nickel transport system substrate-binding protein